MNVAISAPFIALPPLLQLFQSKKMDVQGTWLRSDLCHSLASLRINLRVSKIKDERSKIKDQGSRTKDQKSRTRDQGSKSKDQGSKIKDRGSMINDRESTILAGLRGETRKKLKKGQSTYICIFSFTVPGCV